MANKKIDDTAQSTAVQSEANAVSEPVFAVETLQKHCLKLFGVSTATFAGATAGIEAREYTVNEMKGIIKEWCGKVVK